MQPLVSIIIPTYNSEKYIREALESALNQTYRNIEIIVVDDGSTDNTKEVLKHYLDRIQYIYKKNAGPASARNVGIKHAKGEYIAFLDSDDMWLPEKIELQLGVFVKDQRIGLVSCNDYEIDEKGQILGESKHIHYPSQKALFNALLVQNVVSGGSNAIIKKECFDKVGLFDEHLHGTEDWDMWLRIAQRYDVIFVERPLVTSRVRNNSISSHSNAAKMLKYELLVIDKLFSSKSGLNLFNFLLKRKIYGYRYFRTSNSCKLIGNDKDAKRHILKSFYLYPFNFLNKSYLLLVFYCLLGNKIFTRLKEYYKKV
jgi:glycosyltransferase involved in cell wall biosynthesis